MIVELLAMAAILVGGGAAVRTAGVSGWAVAPLGFLVGVCLLLGIGLVQVVTPVPTWPALTLALTGGAPLAWWVLWWRAGGDVTVPLRQLALVLAALVPVVAGLRAAHLAKWHTDSFTYLMAGSLLADDRYAADVATRLLAKRTLGVPLLHAPANLSGDYFFPSVHPLLAAATLAAVIWFFRRGAGSRLAPATLTLFATLGALLLLSANRFVFSAFYLNGHLLTAMLLLLIAGSGWLLARATTTGPMVPVPALMLLQLVAIPALVVTRPEGPALAGLALLPTWLATRIPASHRMVALAVLAAANTLWQGFGAWLHYQRGVAVPLAISGSLALGIALVAVLPLLRSTRPLPHRPVMWTVEIGLWLALAGLAIRRPDILFDSLHATWHNLVHGAGQWGLTLVALAVLVAGALLLAARQDRVRELAYLRFPVTTFLPLGLLLAYLRDTPYRIGYGDSLSRMFMHVVPLAVLLVITAALAHRAAGRPRDDQEQPGSQQRRRKHPVGREEPLQHDVHEREPEHRPRQRLVSEHGMT